MGYVSGRLAVSVLSAVTAGLLVATGAIPGGDAAEETSTVGELARSVGDAGGDARRFQAASRQPWSRLADCESGDPGIPGSARWSANTGNGYFGGLQFSPSSWAAVGGTGEPHRAPRDLQVETARRLHRRQGFSAWPACARRLGLISAAGPSR